MEWARKWPSILLMIALSSRKEIYPFSESLDLRMPSTSTSSTVILTTSMLVVDLKLEEDRIKENNSKKKRKMGRRQ